MADSVKSASMNGSTTKIVPTPLPKKHRSSSQEEDECPLYILISTYLGYLMLTMFGHLRDFFGKIFCPLDYKHLKEHDGYAPLISDFESFYTRRMYHRIRDCWNRPTTGVPNDHVTYLERFSDDGHRTFKLTGRKMELINLSSYNYLGFAQNEGPCVDEVIETINKLGVATGGARSEGGNTQIIEETEKFVAEFVGKEAAMIFGMGFGTNATMIPALVGPGCLIISDEFNHSSLVFGSRLSGASIRVFKHNDIEQLEMVLREAISQGQSRTHRPWKKILVIVEGLYSMEGTICALPDIVALRKKYKFCLFVDEAHSIGALGPRGRGVCDLFDVDPEHVDVLMGTFTKSFGAAGGYIAGSRALIESFRVEGQGYVYTEPITPPVCQQILTSMRIIAGRDGTNDGQRRLNQIRENSIYFMRRLKKMGFIVYGDEGSPVIPMLIFNPAKIAAFSREALARGLAVVVVGYPATPIITSRVRFCISAAHNKVILDEALVKVSEIGDLLQLKLSSKRYPDDW